MAGDQYVFNNELKYTVASGDSLWKIAERFYGDGNLCQEIINANQTAYPTLLTTPETLQIGWNLSIP